MRIRDWSSDVCSSDLLDFLFHSIAWARKEDLHGRLTDCSAAGFSESMLVSCHALIRMARLAEPLMDRGGSMTTLSYYGAEKVVDHYIDMGPVKAALEASVHYLAHELGQIRSEACWESVRPEV